MLSFRKRWQSKFLIPVLYSAAILVMVLYVWNAQIALRRAPSSGLFRNLMEYPAYIRRGFDPADIRRVPDVSAVSGPGTDWYRFQAPPLRIADSPISDLPKQSFFSIFKRDAEEFTILIALEMDNEAISVLNGGLVTKKQIAGKPSIVPGIYFAIIGDNWDIYLNGKRVRSEMYLDGMRNIRSHRVWRDVYFPVDKSLLHLGTNILALRIVGDPAYTSTGLYYTAPYYLDDYRNIEKRHRPFLPLILCGAFAFTGIYHLMFFFSVKHNKEIFNCYFGILSLLLCGYSLARNGSINTLIPNSDISSCLECLFIYMSFPMLGFFFESLGWKKITIPSRVYMAFCLILNLGRMIFSPQNSETLVKILNISALPYITFVFFYDLVYFYFRYRRETSAKTRYTATPADVPLANIIFGTAIAYVCGLFDLLDVIFFHFSFNIFQYSFSMITLGIAFTLASRFSGLYDRLGKTNTSLETAVHERTMELEKQTEIAISASRAKSNFLASMSHEIRTPLNAIIGMGELALRTDSLPKMAEYVRGIKQAGITLLSIINDILDFSKIEAGKLEILPVSYNLASLINDVVNIIRMRIGEKPIRFFTNIDPSLPSGLFGDEVRIRQILLNLLNNAVKYTHKGFVGLTIIGEMGGGEISLQVEVSDNGIGIKAKDMDKLFGEFSQVDTKRNKDIEGTGLGLAITKRLCVSMGGDLRVSSIYGQGSVFTALIPQGIDSSAPFAQVENPEQKPVLIYEQRLVYVKSIGWTLDRLGVPWTSTVKEDEFIQALGSREWYYVFTRHRFHDFVRSCFDRMETQSKKPRLALMVERNTEASVLKARPLSMPTQALSLANVLNNVEDNWNGFRDAKNFTGVKFTIPGARLLVVDDIAVNLQVAQGLLSPYEAKVDTCLSGAEAVELVKRNSYDLVFMDHMMPDMDGVEATAAIRAWEKGNLELGVRNEEFPHTPLPIIALTADAVSGMREMFLSKGFNDYLAKPIDTVKLEEILSRWTTKKNLEFGVRSEEFPDLQSPPVSNEAPADNPLYPIPYTPSPTPYSLSIPGIDVKQGIAMTGGTEAGYKQVLAIFRRDVEERLPLLRSFVTTNYTDSLSLFITQVHALKSASASIGAAEVSARAADLEAAGKAVLQGKVEDMAVIREKLPAFTEQLAELVRNLEFEVRSEKFPGPQSLSGFSGAPQDNQIPNSTFQISNLLKELAAALESQNIEEIDRLLEELSRQAVDSATKEVLEQISDDVLMAEYDKALETARDCIAKLPEEVR